MSAYEEFPDPMEETSRWIVRNRPDVAAQFDRLITSDAFQFIVAMAFHAGKAYGEKKNTEEQSCEN